ncbi:phosphatidylserine/phosphatidylglycerophosphate/cardiolipin synthase family protein [Streptomyces kanasensis]|uniref:phospholipase D-like domain-containing protein n=1 Tax=Streptomyces kanasensis TaxID=936756 RepID=UPI0036F6FF18
MAPFNTPDSDDAAQREAIKNQLLGLIASAPAGSEIHGSIHLFTDGHLGTALTEAHARGVKVKVLMDGDGRTAAGSEYAKLAKSTALGVDTAEDSFAFACDDARACIGNRTDLSKPPINHNKYFLFSETAGVRNVVFQTSANLTSSQINVYYDNAVTVSRPELYDAYKSYWNAQLKHGRGAGLPEYASTAQAGPHEATFFPRATGDPITALLDKADCRKVAAAEVTKIRVGTFAFTRREVAERLVRLRQAGCQVYVFHNAEDGNLGAEVDRALTAGRLNAYRGCRGTATDGTGAVRAIGLHSKYLLIEGTYDGVPNSKIVFTGSHDYTVPNLRGNDETVLRIDDRAVYDKFEHNFDDVLNGVAPKTGICGVSH